MKGKPLRVLIVEDEERDAALLLRELKQGGFDVTSERVDTPESMSEALDRRPWDLVISDYHLPRLTGPAALAIVKERSLDLPFIIVSGTVGEDVAVEAIRAGAHDFMAKGKFARLVPAIERELRDAVLRKDRARLQEQLLISDRMASVGTLAAGVAHEINNPLAALMGNLDFALRELALLAQKEAARPAAPAGEGGGQALLAERLREIEEPLKDAREAANRVRHIVKDLKIFSRGDDRKTGAVDIRHVLESSLRMAWNEIRHRARLVKDYREVPLVEANEARLGQVFLNLIINAAQAIPEGNAELDEIRIITREDGQGRVVVEIHDTGSGIPEPVLSRIFDAFFTTKPIGVGTGLGLAICHRIVTGFGGEITVRSQVGKGTVFQVALPAARGDDREEAPPAAQPVAAEQRRRILVVDDEPLMGVAIRRMLAPDHEVIVTTSAREVIDRVRRGERFDVILSDLMMPEVTGMDLHAELSALADQAARMIFMTGGAFTSRALEFFGEVRNPRLEKPFDAGTLRALIQGGLGQEPGTDF